MGERGNREPVPPPAYRCENCGHVGPMDDFQDECRPGWTHGRLRPFYTREQAGAIPLPGHNIACQCCGSFGAAWHSSYIRQGRNSRFCPTCSDEVVKLAVALQNAEQVRFTQDGKARERSV